MTRFVRALDLREHVGKVVRVRIVDQHKGHWGHINFDDFLLHASKPAGEDRKPAAAPLAATPIDIALGSRVKAVVTGGVGALLAIGWELAEWWTFIRHGTELATAYTDTLGDLVLGTLGGIVAEKLVERGLVEQIGTRSQLA